VPHCVSNLRTSPLCVHGARPSPSGALRLIPKDLPRDRPDAMQRAGGWTRKPRLARANRPTADACPFGDESTPMLRFRRMKTLQKSASVRANVHTSWLAASVNPQRHRVDRQTYNLPLGRTGRVAVSHGLGPCTRSYSSANRRRVAIRPAAPRR